MIQTTGLIRELKIDTEAMKKTLVNLEYQAKALNVPIEELKPCMADILTYGCKKTELDLIPYYIATELRALKLSDIQAVDVICKWSNRSGLLLPKKFVEDKVRYAYTKGEMGRRDKTGYKGYGCDTSPQMDHCTLGKDECPCYKKKYAQPLLDTSIKGNGMSTFVTLGWVKPLTGIAIKTYYGLCLLEKQENRPAGTLIIANIRDIGNISGIGKSSVFKALDELASHGLLEVYKKGFVHWFKHTATEVKRAIPIPRINARPAYTLEDKAVQTVDT